MGAALPGVMERRTTVWWAERRPTGELDLRHLSAVERDRIDRHRTEPGRDRSALARVLVRAALAELLGGSPGRFELDWRRGPVVVGDPWPDPDAGPEATGADAVALPRERIALPVRITVPRACVHGPWLSVSHSGERVAVAISTAGLVGVDIEAADRGETLRPTVVDRITTLAERDMLARRSDADRAGAAIQLWTAKEAILKATGDGLNVAPHTVELLGEPHPTDLTRFEARPELVGETQLMVLASGTGYVGSLALLSAEPAAFVERDAEALLAASRSSG